MNLKAADRYRIEARRKLDLGALDPSDTSLVKGGKSSAAKPLRQYNERLAELQDLLYAEHQHKLLIVLQGMDTAGKDGTIRRVFEGMDPVGVRVASFKVPTEEELGHDFLWRVHRQVPGKGEVVIFNRSHYEDVLIVRVHQLVPAKVWQQRYEQIRSFERMLTETGTTILKFFLYIDKDEQKKRLQNRLDDPTKHWKFRLGDLDERKRWDDYLDAYEDAIRETSRDSAPWFIVPSNAKWYRNLVISDILIETLEGLKMKYPEPEEDLVGVIVE